MNKEFFQEKAPKKCGNKLTKLKCQDGTITEDPYEIVHIATNFYVELLLEDNDELGNEEDIAYVVSMIQSTLNEKAVNCLAQPISLGKISDALHSYCSFSCPSSDGIRK